MYEVHIDKVTHQRWVQSVCGKGQALEVANKLLATYDYTKINVKIVHVDLLDKTSKVISNITRKKGVTDNVDT